MILEQEFIDDVIRASIIEVIESEGKSIGRDSLTKDFKLFSTGSLFDSIGFVNLIITLEQNLHSKNIHITIMDEKAFSEKNSPFKDIASLSQYIKGKL